MNEYLVRIEIDTGDLGGDEVSALRSAEARRAEELTREGRLNLLWRVPGRWANVGLWSAADKGHLQDVLATLPLHPYMAITIEDLEPHPSSPQSPVRKRAQQVPLSALPDLSLRTRSSDLPGARRVTEQPVALPDLPILSVRSRRGTRLAVSQGRPDAIHTWSSTRDLDVTSSFPVVRGSGADAALFEAASSALKTPQLNWSHSGAHGLDSSSARRHPGVTVDVGRLRRVALVRLAPDGTEVLQIRTVTTITIGGDEPLPLEDVGQLFEAVARGVVTVPDSAVVATA